MKDDSSTRTEKVTATAAKTLPQTARWLGLAGLAPQVLLAAALLADPERFGPTPAGVALVYAGLILSFVGGAWWGLASRSTAAVHGAVWVAAVTPSLIAFATSGAWAIGVPVGTTLWITGAALIGTLAVDRRLVADGVAPPGWLGLRVPLSLGLGALTILVAIVSQRLPG